MAFTAPRTWSAADVATASLLNTHLRDNMDAAAGANKAAVRAYKSSAFTHNSSGNWLALTFDSERFDTQSIHSTSTNTDRLTVPSGWGGLWLVGASMNWAANSTGSRFARLRVNATTEFAEAGGANTGASLGVPISFSGLYRASAGDYFTVDVWQNSGGSLDVNAQGNYSPEFWAVWIGA